MDTLDKLVSVLTLARTSKYLRENFVNINIEPTHKVF